MSAWEDVVASALLGTERRPPAAPAGSAGAAADAVLAALPWAAEPEAALLGAAGLLGVARRAGVRALRVEEAPTPAPVEAQPVCSPRALALLRHCLAESDPALALRWLTLCARAGRRLPPQRLPTLLDRATARRELRAAVRAAGGARLGWLAAQEPRWAWAAVAAAPAGSGAAAEVGGAAGPSAAAADGGGGSADGRDPAPDGPTAGSGPPLRAWSIATADERAALLDAARGGGTPDDGRALVASSWAQDPPEQRARWVEALAHGLGDADEPFLEAALDDKRKPVRAAVAELLDRLPGSRRAERMAARLSALLSEEGRVRRHLAVALPGPPDQDAIRDGLAAKGPDGVRAANLHRIVSAAPLERWSEVTGHDPDALLARLGGDTAPTVLHALVRAAHLQRDPAWAIALAETLPARTLLAHPDGPALLGLLAPGDRADVLERLFRAAEPRRALELLTPHLPDPLSPSLSARVVDVAAQAAATGWWNDAAALIAIALRVDPSVRSRIARHRDQLARPRPFPQLLGLLDLRLALDEAFAATQESP